MRNLQAKALNFLVCNPWLAKKAANKFAAFIIETLSRIIARNPAYTNISIAITVGVCGIIGAICNHFTPGAISVNLDNMINTALFSISGAITAYGQTVVQPEIKGLDANSAVVKQDVAATRPFTSIMEANKAASIGKANVELGK